MTLGKLSDMQVEVLRLLAGVEPRWRLAGGAALAGFHTHHRGTRDLDLFWSATLLPAVESDAVRMLTDAGFSVDVLQRDPAFVRMRVSRGQDTVVVDFVADSVASVEPPVERTVADASILVDPPHEILVSKLCALLSRSELRDLEDVRAILLAGGDVPRALQDAALKEAAFSPITLAWVLEQFPVGALGRALRRNESEVQALETFRTELTRAILDAAKPG